MKSKLYIPQLIIFLLFSAAACGDNEPRQREAFIKVLNERFLAKPGVHTVKIDEITKKELGPYFEHLTVLSDFHNNMDSVMKNIDAGFLAFAKVRINENTDDNIKLINAVKKLFFDINTAMDTELAKSIAQKDALNQPDDLKQVFDKVFEKNINMPVTEFKQMSSVIEKSLDANLALNEFIAANSDKLAIKGMMVEIKDPSIDKQVKELMQAVRTGSSEVNAAVQNFHKAMRKK